MSLRKIHKDVSSGKDISKFNKGTFLSSIGIGEKQHFRKLKREHTIAPAGRIVDYVPDKSDQKPSAKHVRLTVGKEGGKIRKDLIPIAAIVAIAIAVIVLELSMWGGGNPAPIAPPAPAANNTTIVTPPAVINTTVEKPSDIELVSLSFDKDSISARENVSASIILKNGGESNLSNIDVYLYAGNSKVGEKSFAGSILPGESTSVTIVWAPLDEYVGTHTMKAVADPRNATNETNEGNNGKTAVLTVLPMVIEDISANFTMKSKSSGNQLWFSEKYRIPPTSGDGYKYFQLSESSANSFYLDVSIPGFMITRINNLSAVAVPDSSESGWSRNSPIGKNVGGDPVWNGPMLRLSFSVSGGKLTAQDSAGVKSIVKTTSTKIKEVKLVMMKVADWPEEIFRTYKVPNAPNLNVFVPGEFYEFKDNTLYVFPMMWNLKAETAKVTTWLRLEVIMK